MVLVLFKFDFSVVRYNMVIKFNNNFLIIMGILFFLLLVYYIKKEGKEVLFFLFVISNFFDNFILFFVIIVVMRVVVGIFGGCFLKMFDGKIICLIIDKVKGVIFNMIGFFFEGGCVLDFFFGSGSLVIEVILRGMD